MENNEMEIKLGLRVRHRVWGRGRETCSKHLKKLMLASMKLWGKWPTDRSTHTTQIENKCTLAAVLTYLRAISMRFREREKKTPIGKSRSFPSSIVLFFSFYAVLAGSHRFESSLSLAPLSQRNVAFIAITEKRNYYSVVTLLHWSLGMNKVVYYVKASNKRTNERTFDRLNDVLFLYVFPD